MKLIDVDKTKSDVLEKAMRGEITHEEANKFYAILDKEPEAFNVNDVIAKIGELEAKANDAHNIGAVMAYERAVSAMTGGAV